MKNKYFKKHIQFQELVTNILKFLKKNILLISLFAFIGLLIGISKYYTRKKIYETDFVISYKGIEKSLLSYTFDKINNNFYNNNIISAKISFPYKGNSNNKD